jgi:hypothetical protein
MVTHTCIVHTTACMPVATVCSQHFTKSFVGHCQQPLATAICLYILPRQLQRRKFQVQRVCNHSTWQARAKNQQVETFTRCQIKHAESSPAPRQMRVEEACLLVYESLYLSRAFLRHFGLAQLTTPPPVLGHNLPQHHSKAVDINLQHSWQAGHAV